MSRLNLKILKQGRINILASIENLSLQKLNTIHKHYNNNIIWQIAHLIATTDLLLYKLSQLKPNYPDTFINTFKKGTAPDREYSKAEFEQWKSDFMNQIEIIENDIEKNIFVNYDEYTNSFGITLHTFEEALTFICVHEAMHFGDIKSICRH